MICYQDAESLFDGLFNEGGLQPCRADKILIGGGKLLSEKC